MTYTYTTTDGSKSVTKHFPMGKARRRVRVGTQWAYRDYAADALGGQKPNCWPQTSWAAGVLPSQAGEAYANSVKNGVPTQFSKDGDPIFTSRKHRARYLRSVGMFDRNAGYGDPAPVNR